jgi:hypothetical protein
MATDILERLAIANRLTRALKGHYFGVPDAGSRAHLASAIDWA